MLFQLKYYFHWMRIDAVRVQLAGQFQERVLHLRGTLALQLLLVDFHRLLLDRLRLFQEDLEVGHVVAHMDLRIVVPQFAFKEIPFLMDFFSSAYISHLAK